MNSSKLTRLATAILIAILFVAGSGESSAQIVGYELCLQPGVPAPGGATAFCSPKVCDPTPELFGAGTLTCGDNEITLEWSDTKTSTSCCFQQTFRERGSGDLVVAAVTGFPGVNVGDVIASGDAWQTDGPDAVTTPFSYGADITLDVAPADSVATFCESLPTTEAQTKLPNKGQWTSDMPLEQIKVTYCKRRCNDLDIDVCNGTISGNPVQLNSTSCNEVVYDAPFAGGDGSGMTGEFDAADGGYPNGYMLSHKAIYDVDSDEARANPEICGTVPLCPDGTILSDVLTLDTCNDEWDSQNGVVSGSYSPVELAWTATDTITVAIPVYQTKDDGPDAATPIIYDPKVQQDDLGTLPRPPGAVIFCVGDILLPIELSMFNVESNSDGLHLRWSTASEFDNAGFAIELARDGGEFDEIDFVDGQGASSEEVSYEYHLATTPGSYRVRLRQVDFSGTFSYSDVIETVVEASSGLQVFKPYPNPSTGISTIEIAANRADQIRVELFDMQGRVLRDLFEGSVRPHETISLKLDATDLPSGVYAVRVSGGDHRSEMIAVTVRH